MIVMTRSQDHVEAINSTLRKAGHPVHCTWLPDARDLGDALTQVNPEMLIAFIEELGVELAAIMKVRQQTAPEMPVLIVRENVDEAAIAEAMRLGAQDVVTLANRSRLQSVAARELRAYRLERALSTTLSSAREYREQLQNFLEGSADAITHVQEGIIVDANRAWLELFGYSGDDALKGMPLMDLFELETHPALKGALVACLQGKWTDHGLKVRALLSDGSVLPLVLTLTKADYENEPATRISIPAHKKKDHDLEVQLANAVKSDASTRFLQQHYLIAAIRERCAHPIKGGIRQFAYIKPDRFLDIQNTIGVLSSEDFMAQLAELMRAQLTATDLCGRFGGNGILVMLERGTAKDVETWAENIVKRVNDHNFVFEVKKTMGYEVAEQMGWELPDAIFYPTGGGVGMIGMWKAFDEMEKLGWIGSRRPKMIAVQATGCAPIVRAFEENEPRSRFFDNAHTLAAGLRVPKALGDFLVLQALRESHGIAIAVTDDEMLTAGVQLASDEGIYAAPEGAACVAALEKLLASGFLKQTDRIVLYNTGSGLKYPEAYSTRFPRAAASEQDKLGGLITPR